MVEPVCVCRRGAGQVGTGDRSEKIKTYNYKDSRVSDHRIKMNFDLNSIMEGDLEDTLQVSAAAQSRQEWGGL
jgi:peptide chain release factor 1